MRLCARSAEKVRIHRRICVNGAFGVSEGFESRHINARAFVGQVSDSFFSAPAALKSGVSGLTSGSDPVIILPASVKIEEGDMVVLRGVNCRAVRVLRQPDYIFARLERIIC